ncbi:hypothetical protein, partial [Nostoc sp.]|uniref:hypothetical protein n=1 Tax=Nostoc sp. TaxID=1180 RepID=UPI002FF7C860
GSREQGAGSREQGAGSREQGAGSREQGAGSRGENPINIFRAAGRLDALFLVALDAQNEYKTLSMNKYYFL